MKKYKVIVAHAGQQSSFRRAEALKKGGLLYKYITTVYVKKGYLGRLKVFRAISHKEYERMTLRNCPVLEDTEVIQFDVLPNLMLILINRVAKLKNLYVRTNIRLSKKFAQKVARYASGENVNALIMMGAAPAKAFDELQNNNIIKVFDMTSIAYNYQSMIMERMAKKMPEEWRRHISVTSDDDIICELMENISKADHIICTSEFAKSSLIANNIDEKRIHVISYGLEQNEKSHNIGKPGKLSLLYVGSVSCEKGLYFLLEAVKRINSEEIELVLVGKNYIDDKLLEPYKKWCNFIGDIPHTQVENYYLNADVFILPTLFDSFGRVVSEAMSYGIPIISTGNAGAADYIKNGENGFVIPAGDIDSMVEKIRYFLLNRDEVKIMGEKARTTAESHTWEQYEAEYAAEIRRIIENG